MDLRILDGANATNLTERMRSSPGSSTSAAHRLRDEVEPDGHEQGDDRRVPQSVVEEIWTVRPFRAR